MGDEIRSALDVTLRRINDALGELAKPIGQDRAETDYPWIIFSLDDTEYTMNAKYVQRVAILSEIVPYAEAPAYCPGVMWDRKGIIRLLDLRVLLGKGNYLSFAKKGSEIPMIIIIEPDGKRRGMIVDKILVLKYANTYIEASISKEGAQTRHVKVSIKYDLHKRPALIIDPESFRGLEFENQNAKINWKGQIDMGMRTEDP